MSLILLFLAPSLAATLTVGPSDAEFTAIQDAIGASSSGDLIEIAAGTYAECVDLSGKDLALSGVDGAAATTLDGTGCETALVASSAEKATVTGLTITNAGGRCIYAGTATDLALDGLLIVGCGGSAIDGGGVAVEAGTLTVTDSAISDNTGATGGSLLASGGSIVVLDGVEISGGHAETGAGIYVPDEATLTLVDCEVHDNDGAAIHMEDDGTVEIEGGTFADNTHVVSTGWSSSVDVTVEGARLEGNTGGAVVVYDWGTLRVTGSAFLENESAIDVEYGTLDVVDSIFQGHSSEYGAAIYVGASRSATIDMSIFVNNVATKSGGAIYVGSEAYMVTVTNTVFSANQAQSGDGGAIYAEEASLSASACTFEENSAGDDGGAIYSLYTHTYLEDSDFDANSAGGDGGAVHFEARFDAGWSYAQFEGLSFTENLAQGSGGGLYLYKPWELVLSDSTFQSNRAEGTSSSGGGLYVYHSVAAEVEDNQFCGNEAVTGGGASLVHTQWTSYGGCCGSNDWIYNVFSKNVASGSGGGVYLDDNDDLSFYNNTLVGNEGATGGAAAFVNSDTNFYNNIVAYTVAGSGLWASSSSSADLTWMVYNDFYANLDADTAGSFAFDTTADGNLVDSPDFVAWDEDGDCADDDLHLRASSALIEAGMDHWGYTNPDIGAYGVSEIAEDTGGDVADSAADTGGELVDTGGDVVDTGGDAEAPPFGAPLPRLMTGRVATCAQAPGSTLWGLGLTALALLLRRRSASSFATPASPRYAAGRGAADAVRLPRPDPGLPAGMRRRP